MRYQQDSGSNLSVVNIWLNMTFNVVCVVWYIISFMTHFLEDGRYTVTPLSQGIALIIFFIQLLLYF